jgi:hypothetical protein
MNLIASLSRRMLLTLCLVLAACATSPPIGKKDLLNFLSDGVTRRDDVLLKLGEPSTTYESMRILAYRLRKDEAGYVLVNFRTAWSAASYSLILVFDDQGVLRQHALVEVNP